MPTRENTQRSLQAELKTPPLTEAAARIRDGESYRDLAKEYGIDQQGLANRLRNGGYRFDTGEPEREARLREMKQRLSSNLLTYALPWMDEAACASVDPELWFPEKGSSTKEAKAICATCPVLSSCRAYGLERKERFGVLGGLSERDRRKIIKDAA